MTAEHLAFRIGNLLRQHPAYPDGGNFTSFDNPSTAVLDGSFNLEAVAKALLEEVTEW